MNSSHTVISDVLATKVSGLDSQALAVLSILADATCLSHPTDTSGNKRLDNHRPSALSLKRCGQQGSADGAALAVEENDN